jgi:hypothetical protein
MVTTIAFRINVRIAEHPFNSGDGLAGVGVMAFSISVSAGCEVRFVV